MAFTPKDFTVWIEIPVRDLTRAAEYYARVTGAELVDEVMGEQRTFRFPTATAKGVGGHLFQGEPAAEGAGSIIHLACRTRSKRRWTGCGPMAARCCPTRSPFPTAASPIPAIRTATGSASSKPPDRPRGCAAPTACSRSSSCCAAGG